MNHVLLGVGEGPHITLDLLMNILNSAEEGIEAVDIKGNLFLYNASMEALEEQKAEEVLGRHMTEIYHLDWKTSLLLKVLQEKKPIYGQHQIYALQNGKCLDILVSVVPLFEGEEIVGAAAIIRDFSNFRKMAEKILALQEELNTNQAQPAAGPKAPAAGRETAESTMERLIGGNAMFQKTVAWAKEAALSGSPILIYGETGTGKELFARFIHAAGNRAGGPFVAINCAAIPETLLEGILFGTVKGAFTGAVNRPGLFEQASDGTIFLDEVNSMPLALQAKLLRVLEEKSFRRLGGNAEIRIDANVTSSCNIEPTRAMQDGLIRPDLFYRLAVVYLEIPPLRDRSDDIELLAKHFIVEMNRRTGKNILGLRRDVLSAFKKYHWPGNVRQLKHTVECAMSITPVAEGYITADNIPRYLSMDFSHEPEETANRRDASPTAGVLEQIREKEKEAITAALKETNGHFTKAAALLGISRQTLWYRMKKHGMY